MTVSAARRGAALLAAGALLLSGCAGQQANALTRYEASFLTLFDTVTTIVGYAESETAFSALVQPIHDELEEYHRLYDIYHDYPGLTNLKTVNDRAWASPVEVDGRILDLLIFCREVYGWSGGAVNAAMGSVLSLWHEARTDGVDDPANAALPSPAALTRAAAHTDFSCVVLDEDASTVRFTDRDLRLDVGAIAKGFALERVCQSAPSGLLISVGGSLHATGPKPDGSPWVAGIRDPEGGGDYLHTLYLSGGSLVTSGDYQRRYTVNGVPYHHIIDPGTNMPGRRWRSVTVLCGDAALADALSTALFLLSREEGQTLLDNFGAQALWVDGTGGEAFSPGLSAHIRT